MATNARRKGWLAGGNRRVTYHGIFAFTTTGTTKDVDVPMRRVESVIVTPIGASSATEGQLTVNETVSGTAGTADAAIVGSITNNTTTLTVTRADGTLSGRKFALFAIGD